MSDELNINKSLDDFEIYETLAPQVENLLDAAEPVISNLSNFTAALKQSFDKISWVGFYLLKGDTLFLGPFQGKTACTKIKLGVGVCGTAALKKETLIVEDVEKFPGHIACDSGSKSEIVVPLLAKEKVFGVLDLDSYKHAAFNAADKIYLEKLVKLLLGKVNFEQVLL